jgi:dipeptidyl aminopeptidase/acylaminoacyl peptidase
MVNVHPDAESLEDDRTRAEARSKAGASALWWDSYPIRYWDHPLAPRLPRLYVTDTAGAPLRDLTGPVGLSLVEKDFCVTDDGMTVITSWATELGRGERRHDLMTIDVATGERSELAAEEGFEHGNPVVSPDGRWVAYRRDRVAGRDVCPKPELYLLDRQTGVQRRLAPELDRWPESAAFTGDSATVVFTAAEDGRQPVWAVPVEPASAPAARLSADGAFGQVALPWRGDAVYALRSKIIAPPELVVLDGASTDQEPKALHSESFGVELPGRVEQVHARTADGTTLRAWLVLPDTASATDPAPLTVFIHGGPLSSWNAWQWRWQPMLLAARGYAVLLPDPALSLGYGQIMVERGWGQWGGVPYDDVLTLTDSVLLISTRPALPCWVAPTAVTSPTGRSPTPTGSAARSRTPRCGTSPPCAVLPTTPPIGSTSSGTRGRTASSTSSGHRRRSPTRSGRPPW